MEALRRAPPSEEEAFHTAIEFEEMLAQFHMDHAVCFEEGNGGDLFKELMLRDLGHIEEMERALRELVSGRNETSRRDP